MSTAVRRAGAFAVVGSIALAVPLLDEAGVAPFAAIAALAVFTLEDGPVFELFARPGEHRERRLYGLIGFALAAGALALLAATAGMPVQVAVGAILLVAYGSLAATLARHYAGGPVAIAGAYAAGGALACGVGQVAAIALDRGQFVGHEVVDVLPEVAFLAAAGGASAALLRTLLFEADDPPVMLATGLWLWLLSALTVDLTAEGVAAAVAVTVVVGYLSVALDTASVSGMLTGVTMGLVTIVLGGIEWFAVLIGFFGIGGLATKFRYERKLDQGVAEENEGARSTANVLANGAVGLVAVLGYAAAGTGWYVGGVVGPATPGLRTLFAFAFLGSLATATSDTLASEVGGAYDDVRLVTTLKPVEPGTDGGITWQGELAGLLGAATVGGIALALFDAVGPAGAAVVVVAGFAGMTVDSVLGATVEGELVGNGGVNLAATLAGAIVAAAGTVPLGLV